MSNQAAVPPIFDPAAIEKLRKISGDEASLFISEVAQLFLEETRKSLAEVQQATDLGQRDRAARIAHSLKSSAATLGLMRLSAACETLEAAGRAESGPDRTAEVARALREEFEHTVPILRSLG